MYILITLAVILAGLLLGALVLLQNPKGSPVSGLGLKLLGVRQSTYVVEKLTWALAAGMLLLCICTGFAIK